MSMVPDYRAIRRKAFSGMKIEDVPNRKGEILRTLSGSGVTEDELRVLTLLLEDEPEIFSAVAKEPLEEVSADLSSIVRRYDAPIEISSGSAVKICIMRCGIKSAAQQKTSETASEIFSAMPSTRWIASRSPFPLYWLASIVTPVPIP